MKRILIILMILAYLFIFSGCSSLATEDSNEYGYFIKITQYNIPGAWTTFIYDPITKIVYVKILSGHHAGISVYYTIVDRKPEIAIYGVNWTEEDLMKGVR